MEANVNLHCPFRTPNHLNRQDQEQLHRLNGYSDGCLIDLQPMTLNNMAYFLLDPSSF